jgi:UDP-glucose 4-epimerase
MRIAITGISGRFGALLARQLHRQHTVIGIDRRPMRGAPVDVELHRMDIRRNRSEKIFREGKFDAVVHLNVVHNPRASTQDHHSFNIEGTTRVVDYCVKHNIPKLVVLSSANVYGPRAGNSQFLTEDAPLMGGERFSGIRDLVAVDMLVQSFFWKHPALETVLLRPVHIVGQVHNAPSNYLRLKRPPRLMGFDPMIQVVHEEDAVCAIERALAPGIKGVFNVDGCVPTALSQLLALSGGQPVAVPHLVAEAGVQALWNFRLTSFPAPELDHLRYVCMVDASRAREALGYQPRFGLDETMAHLRMTQVLR